MKNKKIKIKSIPWDFIILVIAVLLLAIGQINIQKQIKAQGDFGGIFEDMKGWEFKWVQSKSDFLTAQDNETGYNCLLTDCKNTKRNDGSIIQDCLCTENGERVKGIINEMLLMAEYKDWETWR